MRPCDSVTGTRWRRRVPSTKTSTSMIASVNLPSPSSSALVRLAPLGVLVIGMLPAHSGELCCGSAWILRSMFVGIGLDHIASGSPPAHAASRALRRRRPRRSVLRAGGTVARRPRPELGGGLEPRTRAASARRRSDISRGRRSGPRLPGFDLLTEGLDHGGEVSRTARARGRGAWSERDDRLPGDRAGSPDGAPRPPAYRTAHALAQTRRGGHTL